MCSLFWLSCQNDGEDQHENDVGSSDDVDYLGKAISWKVWKEAGFDKTRKMTCKQYNAVI